MLTTSAWPTAYGVITPHATRAPLLSCTTTVRPATVRFCPGAIVKSATLTSITAKPEPSAE